MKGIFDDPSIFGAYVSYVDRERLNRLIGLAPGEYTMLGIHLRDPRTASRDARRLHDALAQRVPMFAPVATQPDLWAQLGEDWTGVKYAVLTLGGYLFEINDLASAISWGLSIVIVLLLVMVVLGIGTTYRLMIRERTRELGTMRALGMGQPGVRRLIVGETVLLGAICVAIGSALGFPLLAAAGSVRVAGDPGVRYLPP